jgi:hypothetical protein
LVRKRLICGDLSPMLGVALRPKKNIVIRLWENIMQPVD